MSLKFLLLSLFFISINSLEFIKYSEDNDIATITISRPKALNALNSIR